MARYENHLDFDRFFVGAEQPEVHRETDQGWGNGNVLAHLAAHSPLYGLLAIYPRYGPAGLASHLWHVIADFSPLQLQDIGQHLAEFGKRGGEHARETITHPST